MMEGLSADSEEKHEPASDIDTALMDSLKVLDPEGPIREADIARCCLHVSNMPTTDSCTGKSLFDLLVGARGQRRRHVEAERLG